MEIMVYFTWFIHYVYTPVSYDTSDTSDTSVLMKQMLVSLEIIRIFGILKQKRILILDIFREM